MARQLSRADIVSAAARIANTRGVEAMTLTAVAAELGVSTPSLYKHVDGRPVLLRLLTLRAMTGVTKAMTAAVAGRTGPDALRAAAFAWRNYALNHPGVYAAAGPLPIATEPPMQDFVAIRAELVALVGGLLRSSGLDPERQIDVVRALCAGVHGFIVMEQAGVFAFSRTAEESYAALVELLLSALKRPAD